MPCGRSEPVNVLLPTEYLPTFRSIQGMLFESPFIVTSIRVSGIVVSSALGRRHPPLPRSAPSPLLCRVRRVSLGIARPRVDEHCHSIGPNKTLPERPWQNYTRRRSHPVRYQGDRNRYPAQGGRATRSDSIDIAPFPTLQASSRSRSPSARWVRKKTAVESSSLRKAVSPCARRPIKTTLSPDIEP